jgi:hypothetical protein
MSIAPIITFKAGKCELEVCFAALPSLLFATLAFYMQQLI